MEFDAREIFFISICVCIFYRIGMNHQVDEFHMNQ